MKTKKSFLVLTAAALAFALAFNACSNGGGGPSNFGGSSATVKFDLTGAKAIAATSGGSRSARAVTAGNDLKKILANDTFVSILSGNQYLSRVIDILRSPVEGKKDIYIIFYSGVYYETDDGKSVYISQFIHVKEDGTVNNVFDYDNRLYVRNAQDLSFDQNGNLFFKHRDMKGSTMYMDIYKYNPETYKEERLIGFSCSIGDDYLNNVELSSDGTYVITLEREVGRDNNVRITPIANPSAAYNIEKVNGKNLIFGSFAYQRKTNEIYFLGSVDGEGSIHKLSSVNGGHSKDDWQFTTLAKINGSELGLNETYSEIYIAPDNSIWSMILPDSNQGFVIAKTVNSNGQPDFRLPNVFANGDMYANSYSSLKFLTPYLYIPTAPYNSKVNAGIPFRSLYRVEYDNPGNAEYLFKDVATKRNTNNMTVLSYSVAGNDLYFSAAENYNYETREATSYFGGKIDMSTPAFKYTEFKGEQITAIVGY